jgi:hypothetical protein
MMSALRQGNGGDNWASWLSRSICGLD